MLNSYDAAAVDLHFRKFKIGDILFVEYTCPIKDEHIGIWSQCDYLIHVLSGKKSWHTLDNFFTASAGQTIYVKKGAAIIKQYFDDEFCMLIFFLPDDFLKKAVSGLLPELSDTGGVSSPGIMEIDTGPVLKAYFHSMLSYLKEDIAPPDELLLIKLKELIIYLAGTRHFQLSSYFRSLNKSGKPDIAEIMEHNFNYNMSLEEYARLCSRSLSTFKRDFLKQFGVTPGKWLISRRLEFSLKLLEGSNLNISQIVFECGFEDLSHFSRVFKQKFGISPNSFRKEITAHTGKEK